MKQFEGKNITVVRSVTTADPGYDKAKDQVIVKFDDGTQKTVLRSDVKDA